jgi:hypothetical protein
MPLGHRDARCVSEHWFSDARCIVGAAIEHQHSGLHQGLDERRAQGDPLPRLRPHNMLRATRPELDARR